MNEIASRYASALVSIAKDEKKLSEYKLAILSVEETLEANPELFKYLKSYFVKDSEKELVVDELAKPYKLDNFTNFLKLLVSKHKIHLFKDIVKEVTKGINYQLDIYKGFVYSIEPLENSKIFEISQVISKKLHKPVIS